MTNQQKHSFPLPLTLDVLRQFADGTWIATKGDQIIASEDMSAPKPQASPGVFWWRRKQIMEHVSMWEVAGVLKSNRE